ncbi:MAG: MTAP family purine nucleoside phosphorylase [Phycisphaerae bacterium]|jgi:5'-methylthioadenosine phosphorylase|nr:MTAP family purine nucleoside phosphorylase [Phycisphaerae bacterium]
MPVTTACITGGEIHRQWRAGIIRGELLGPQDTPYGPSGDLFLADSEDGQYYLLARYGTGMAKTAPFRVNHRANIYALKNLGVQTVLAWGSGAAITHSMAVGDIVILNDVVDRTHLRKVTFFEDSPLGFLRQFPVFCPRLQRVVGGVLHDMRLIYHGAGVAAITEGPRMETPAEVRALASQGAEIVTHTFAPEMFLARELQMCYAALCYVLDYAEAGSRQPPLGGALFESMKPQSRTERLAGVVGSLGQIVANVAASAAEITSACHCEQIQSENIEQYGLPEDWRQWFGKD